MFAPSWKTKKHYFELKLHACMHAKKKKYYCDTDGRKSKPGWTLTSIPTQEVRKEGQDLFRESLNLKT